MHDFTAFENRLRKLATPRKKWAQKEQTDAYRLYEQDIPELRYIVDIYGEQAVVYDRRLASEIESEAADRAHDEALINAVTRALALGNDKVHLKRRRRISDREDQYVRLGQERTSFTVREQHARYKVNLTDYLDTGLFLDHRPLRKKFRSGDVGPSFLNLFCYTGSVSVAAAMGGAHTTSIDLSSTYLEWAQENFRLSMLDPKDHQFIRADAREFIARGPQPGQKLFDTIFLDPPSFSNSKKMAGTFDIQRDHRQLLLETMRFLAPHGILWFSTNLSKFMLDAKIGQYVQIVDVTAETVPDDFRNKLIHRCYRLSAKDHQAP